MNAFTVFFTLLMVALCYCAPPSQQPQQKTGSADGDPLEAAESSWIGSGIGYGGLGGFGHGYGGYGGFGGFGHGYGGYGGHGYGGYYPSFGGYGGYGYGRGYGGYGGYGGFGRGFGGYSKFGHGGYW